eukprot:GILJ01014217.1.p1 GENE.GILJ01014217.1~~GILJ01014217.1.p1  ORF type:complete len:1231 (+),score=201.06 GILJ01014217.1:499-3693(+)
MKDFGMDTGSTEWIFSKLESDSVQYVPPLANHEIHMKNLRITNVSMYWDSMAAAFVPSSLWEATRQAKLGIFSALAASDLLLFFERSISRDGVPPPYHSYILLPTSVDVQVIKNKSATALSESHSLNGRPRYQISILTNKVNLLLDPEMIADLHRWKDFLAKHRQWQMVRPYRPRVRPQGREGVRQWWMYALWWFRVLRSGWGLVTYHLVHSRACQRAEYLELYKKTFNKRDSIIPWRRNYTPSSAEEDERRTDIELSLTIAEITQYRALAEVELQAEAAMHAVANFELWPGARLQLLEFERQERSQMYHTFERTRREQRREAALQTSKMPPSLRGIALQFRFRALVLSSCKSPRLTGSNSKNIEVELQGIGFGMRSLEELIMVDLSLFSFKVRDFEIVRHGGKYMAFVEKETRSAQRQGGLSSTTPTLSRRGSFESVAGFNAFKSVRLTSSQAVTWLWISPTADQPSAVLLSFNIRPNAKPFAGRAFEDDAFADARSAYGYGPEGVGRTRSYVGKSRASSVVSSASTIRTSASAYSYHQEVDRQRAASLALQQPERGSLTARDRSGTESHIASNSRGSVFLTAPPAFPNLKVPPSRRQTTLQAVSEVPDEHLHDSSPNRRKSRFQSDVSPYAKPANDEQLPEATEDTNDAEMPQDDLGVFLRAQFAPVKLRVLAPCIDSMREESRAYVAMARKVSATSAAHEANPYRDKEPAVEDGELKLKFDRHKMRALEKSLQEFNFFIELMFASVTVTVVDHVQYLSTGSTDPAFDISMPKGSIIVKRRNPKTEVSAWMIRLASNNSMMAIHQCLKLLKQQLGIAKLPTAKPKMSVSTELNQAVSELAAAPVRASIDSGPRSTKIRARSGSDTASEPSPTPSPTRKSIPLDSHRSSLLMKQSSGSQTQQATKKFARKRWFKLEDGYLFYFPTEGVAPPASALKVENNALSYANLDIQSEAETQSSGWFSSEPAAVKPFVFQLAYKNAKLPFTMAAGTQEEMMLWVKALNEWASHSGEYQLEEEINNLDSVSQVGDRDDIGDPSQVPSVDQLNRDLASLRTDLGTRFAQQN